MTNNQLTDIPVTDDEIQRVLDAFDYRTGIESHEEHIVRCALAELQERRKADSEPVGYFGRFDPDDEDLIDQCSKNVKGAFPLYRHAQPAPEYPETLPCPVLLEPGMRFGKGVKTRLVLDAIQRRAEHYAELEAMTPEERAEYEARIAEFKSMLPKPSSSSITLEMAVAGGDAFVRCEERSEYPTDAARIIWSAMNNARTGSQ